MITEIKIWQAITFLIGFALIAVGMTILLGWPGLLIAGGAMLIYMACT